MSTGILAVIDSIEQAQVAAIGDFTADAIVRTTLGDTLRGQVRQADGVVRVYQRLVTHRVSIPPAHSDETLNERVDGGTSEIPIHIAAEHIVSVNIFGAGR